MRRRSARTFGLVVLLCASAALAQQTTRPDGLYAEIRTSKGLIVARLEPDLAPVAVANFVGLAEGTIANAAFDLGRPFYDGTVFHRVVPGHVIQTGIPQSSRARAPGYTFPNELHARLSHNHAGALNMANAGPGTNSSQFCFMLGDRGYLDGDFTVFGDAVEGLDVIQRIVQGDTVESVRIVRAGAKAQAFHPTTDSFRAQVRAAEQSAAEHLEKKRAAEREWVARTYPNAKGPDGGVLSITLSEGAAAVPGEPLQVRYKGVQARYADNIAGREGPPIETGSFGSGASGVPGLNDPPLAFPYIPGQTRLNPGLDAALANMQPGERRILVVPAALAFGRSGLYGPDIPGQRRFKISPNTLLVYDVEMLTSR